MIRIDVMGRQWAVFYAPERSLTAADQAFLKWLPLLIAAVLAALAAWLLGISHRTERRAVELAERMTQSLRESQTDLARSNAELERFAVQFFAFVKCFPRILATLLANTTDDDDADELATIPVSELGDGDPKRRHEYLYHRFLRSIGIDPAEAARRSWLPSRGRTSTA